MMIHDVLDLLDEASDRVEDALSARDYDASLVKGEGFSLRRIHSGQHDSRLQATILVDLPGGLRLPLAHGFEPEAFADEQFVGALVDSTLAIIDEVVRRGQLADRQLQIAEAVQGCFGSAVEDGTEIHTLSLEVLPIQIGGWDGNAAFELRSCMLDKDLDAVTIVSRIKNADEFRECFAEEIMPMQRARTAKLVGYDVPEASND
jgi:hypothetical protein